MAPGAKHYFYLIFVEFQAVSFIRPNTTVPQTQVYSMSQSYLFSNEKKCHINYRFTLQVRQSIVKEYDQVKEINQTLANFKKDTVHFGGPRRSHEEEPTRDPDVWPAPTPVERDNRYTEMPHNHDYLISLMVLCHCVYLKSFFGRYQVTFKYL